VKASEDAAASRLSSEGLGYKPALDGLRAIAVGVVLLFHARLDGFHHGAIGVDVFFVLSGFLITSLLVSEFAGTGGIRFGNFYRRRALRLLPAFYAAVVLALALEALSRKGGTLRGAVLSVVYSANWAVAINNAGLGKLLHTWSLSIEEQFYLVWPVALVLILRASRNRLGVVIASISVLMVLSYAEAVFLVSRATGNDSRVMYGTDTRACELLAGCLLAVCLARARTRGWSFEHLGRIGQALGVVGLGALLVMVSYAPASDFLLVSLEWPLIAVASVLVILAAAASRGPVQRLLSARALVAVGAVSYGIYLVHFPIFVFLDERIGLGGIGVALVGTVLTAGATVLCYRFVELPFLRRKQRMPGRGSRVRIAWSK
jgi:peptidoglycan/LPS O-acetylase OafA/YrhL